jgi:hypothetical protein
MAITVKNPNIPAIDWALQRPDEWRTKKFFSIVIGHIPTNKEVTFEGWVTSFSDAYTSTWAEENVYGRMDPLATFEGTRRVISVEFAVPNDSKTHAAYNMGNLRRLIKFMYPVFEQGGRSIQNTLKAPPLLTMKWTNLASNADPSFPEGKLVGYINGGVTYAPEVGDGGFIAGGIIEHGEKSTDSDQIAVRNYYPKTYSLGFSFSVLHTHLPGWAPAPGSDPTKTTSYLFSGDKLIDARYPNVFVNPVPEDVIQSRAKYDEERRARREDSSFEDEIEQDEIDARENLQRSEAERCANEMEMTNNPAWSCGE